jgi:DNA modification methylase
MARTWSASPNALAERIERLKPGEEYLETVYGADGQPTGTSIFDATLCELIYRWFCPPKSKVLDPFAGGSVRGIAAGILGLDYVGIELSKGQLEANRKQAKDILSTGANGWAGKKSFGRVQWIEGDALKAAVLAPGSYDLIFSRPPYGDLEVYSDDPRDLSTMPHDKFLEAYRQVIRVSCGMLKPNRFACFVVGDYRDKQGFYRNFVSDTIAAFESAHMKLYNEAILVTAVGSLPIRIGTAFGKYRKLGKTHQNVLVFYNGDVREIPKEFPEIEVVELASASIEES